MRIDLIDTFQQRMCFEYLFHFLAIFRLSHQEHSQYSLKLILIAIDDISMVLTHTFDLLLPVETMELEGSFNNIFELFFVFYDVLAVLEAVDEVSDIGSILVWFIVGKNALFLVVFAFDLIISSFLQPQLELLQFNSC